MGAQHNLHSNIVEIGATYTEKRGLAVEHDLRAPE
jgi:hypothetical protein